MPTHEDLLNDMDVVKRALIGRYKWLIHVTQEDNLDRPEGIRATGLITHSVTKKTPPEVVRKFGKQDVPITCFNPLGAKGCPRPVTDPTAIVGVSKPTHISLAVDVSDLPPQVGLDWTYSWNCVERYLQNSKNQSIEEIVANLANEYGSVVVYEEIPPDKLRAYCEGNSPTNPLSWMALRKASNIIRHYS